LADVGEVGRLLLQPALLSRMHLTQRPARFIQGCAEAIGKLPKGLAFVDGPGGSDTFERIRGNERRMHGGGLRLRQGQLTDLLPYIPRHERDRRWHCGHHPLRFLDAIQARLAESFLMGDGADGVDVVWDITDDQLPVSPDASLQVDKVVGVTDGAEALSERFSLLGEPRPPPTRPAEMVQTLKFLSTKFLSTGAFPIVLWQNSV